MTCNHPDPDLCLRLGRHIFGPLWDRWYHDENFRKALEAMPRPVAKVRMGYRALKCLRQGERLEQSMTGGPLADVNDCELHDRCTRSFVCDKIKACSLCEDYVPTREPWQWISMEKLTRDTIAMAGKLPRNVTAIAGVPRSGMIPASILARIMHLPLWEAPEDSPPRPCSSGNGGKGITTQGPLLIVDDTVMWGSARKKIRAAARSVPHIYAAVYVREGEQHQVDYFWQAVPTLHVLEWNWANNGGIKGWSGDPNNGRGFAVDLDGIIVHDHESGGLPGTAFMVPRSVPVPYIITARPERDRAFTVRQLQEVGCRYSNLIMRPADVDETSVAYAFYKAQEFDRSGCELFIESDKEQAELIHIETLKPVACPRIGRVFQLEKVPQVPSLDGYTPMTAQILIPPFDGRPTGLEAKEGA